jgi:1,3-beta-glucanosyltransferase GAS1
MIMVSSLTLSYLDEKLTLSGLVSIDGDSVSTLDDFNYLSSQIAQINPTGPNSAEYNPTNTAAAACPTVGSDWRASSDLPPTPNQQLCECMFNALTCVPNNVQDNEIGDLFGIVCGLSDTVCDGIVANATEGNYGAYGMCNPTQQLGWALNVYYNQQNAAGNAASACDFSGAAKTQQAAAPSGECEALINEAGQNGQGTVTSAPTATGGSGSGGSSSSNAGVPGFSQSSTVGMFQAGVYLLVAAVSGAGMILL